MTNAYRKRIALSQAHIDAEIRAVVSRMSHRSIQEIVVLLRERNIAVDPDYVRELLDLGRLDP